MSNPQEFYLPELPRLLPFAYHPKAAQIEFASNGWVRRMLGTCFGNYLWTATYHRYPDAVNHENTTIR